MDVESFEAVDAMNEDCRPILEALKRGDVTFAKALQFAWQSGYQRGQIAIIERETVKAEKTAAELKGLMRDIDALARAAHFDDETTAGAHDGLAAGEG